MARSSATAKGRRAAIVAGLRTPFVRAGTDFAQLDVLDLARAVTVELLLRTGLDPSHVDHVIYGNVTRPVQYTNLARELVLAAGLPKRTPADTVTLACASACQAITDATNLIERGYADVVVAGGVEMLSNVPIALSPPLARALVSAAQARSIGARLQSFRHLALADLPPVTPSIAETSTGLSMGQSAELMAKLNGISRADQDAWALGSHRKAAAAWADGQSLPPAQATSEALALLESLEHGQAGPCERAAAQTERSDPLTPREREVAALVARGLSNRAIATELVITEATVERHVGNIFAKLGLASRAQLAVWAHEHGLAPKRPD